MSAIIIGANGFTRLRHGEQTYFTRSGIVKPPTVRSDIRQSPWKEMVGMRENITHFYFGVDREAIWIAVKERTPSLKPTISQILEDLKPAEG